MLPTFDFLVPDSYSHPICPTNIELGNVSLSQAPRKHLPNAKLFFYTSTNKKGQIQKIFERLGLLSLSQKMQHVRVKSYLILASAAALLSVFWNKARIRLFTSAAENSAARGPFPSAHLHRRERSLFNQTAQKCHIKTSLLSTCYSSKSEGKRNPVSSLLAACNLSPELFS